MQAVGSRPSGIAAAGHTRLLADTDMGTEAAADVAVAVDTVAAVDIAVRAVPAAPQAGRRNWYKI